MNGLVLQGEKNGACLTLAVSGRIDTVTAPQLEQEIQDNIDKILQLVLDFEKVEYISSAGLRVLLSTHKLMMKKEGMTLRNVGAAVMEVFEITGFDSILTVE